MQAHHLKNIVFVVQLDKNNSDTAFDTPTGTGHYKIETVIHKYLCTRLQERNENMLVNMLKGKIHRATVKQAELNYVGSITVDEDLMNAAGILEYEKVQIVDVDNGSRFETYVIAGERGSGMICLNGAAARMVQTGDKIIIMCYAQMTPEEFKENPPKVVFVDDDNHISRITNYEKHGLLKDME